MKSNSLWIFLTLFYVVLCLIVVIVTLSFMPESTDLIRKSLNKWAWRWTESLMSVKGHDIESVKDMQKGRVWKDWGSGEECTWESGWAGFVVTTMLDQLWPKLEEVYKSWPLGGMQGAELEFGGLDTNVSYRTCGMRYSRVQWSELKSESWNSEIIF